MDLELMQSFRSARRMGHTGWKARTHSVGDSVSLMGGAPTLHGVITETMGVFVRVRWDENQNGDKDWPTSFRAADLATRQPSIAPLPVEWTWDDNDGLVML